MMRIVIGTTLWRRHDVERLCLSAVRNAVECDRDLFDVQLVCVGSEGAASRSVAAECGWHYSEHANRPLSKKHNAMAGMARDLDPDVLIVMGSDDWISPGFLRRYAAVGMLGAPGVNVFGLEDILFADTKSERVLHWPGYRALGNAVRARDPIGAFCGLTREALEAVKWRPWPGDLNQGLDRAMHDQLRIRGVRGTKVMAMREAGVCVVDWKSDTNIWTFEKFAAIPGVSEVSTEESLETWFSGRMIAEMRHTGRGKKMSMEGKINHTDEKRPLAGVDVRKMRRESLTRVAPELFSVKTEWKRALYIGANYRRHDFLEDVCRAAAAVDVVEAFQPNVMSLSGAVVPKFIAHGIKSVMNVVHADIAELCARAAEPPEEKDEAVADPQQRLIDDLRKALASGEALYDLVIWWHGPEHVAVDRLPAVLKVLEACGGLVVLGCPWGNYPQGAAHGNAYEVHRSALEPEYFAERGYECDVVGKRGLGSNIAAVKRRAE